MQPGFCIIHANHLETLAELAIQHSKNEPLSPLDNEIVLVQSNGMADWFKLTQAAATGISASMEFPMPASFLWQMYQRVLAPELINSASPFAKDSLQWRLLRLLPELLERPEFSRPRHFLANDLGHSKCFQLARKLADLFDQYQLYRAAWITGWEQGQLQGLGPDEAWQAALWRALIDDLPANERLRSRAHLHAAFLDALKQDTPTGLPQRLYLFGISSMPQQLLEALYAMSRHSQLLLMTLSPCQEYWGDKSAPELDGFAATNPLLESWGGQGRDFLTLLQAYQPDDLALQHTQEINPYAPADALTRPDSIICQLQQAILDNRLPEAEQTLPPQPGLHLYPCYSRQREVEILNDKLLQLFATDPKLGYNDIVVMMPDVEAYAPHIEAVFNRYEYSDPRRLAFSISDRQHHNQPLYQALDLLLGLPDARLTLSEVSSLLQVGAVRKRAGIGPDDLEPLNAWLNACHIHWGLNAHHKQQLLQQPAEASAQWRAHNSWQAGLDQLLAGYCAGSAELFTDTPGLDEVSGNSGELLGLLAAIIERLDSYRLRLARPHTPADWATTFSDLIADFFDADSDDDQLLLGQLRGALDAWQADCELADFATSLPLSQARRGWQDKLVGQGVSQQLSFNGITFCTLMPMRALPFKQVFLLGMNDGAYPHETQMMDFDLMQQAPQPGDRDRRDDDHYLLLEALMSVRDSLHISWVGRDIKRGTQLPPCTLIGQLCDLVDACWQTDAGNSACEQLTEANPLAAFSKHYFLPANDGSAPLTYAHEWLALHQPIAPGGAMPADATNSHTTLPEQLSEGQLATLLKSPLEVFYREHLKVRFVEPQEAPSDDEPFSLNALECWAVRNDLLQSLLHADAPDLERWQHNGALPFGDFGARLLQNEYLTATSIQRRWQEGLDNARQREPQDIHCHLELWDCHYTLTASLDPLWEANGKLLLATASASNLKAKQGWKFDKFALPWVRHLIACAAGLAPTSLLTARDKRVSLAPLSPQAAQRQLQRLLMVYLEAWKAPLDIAKEELVLTPKSPDLGLDDMTASQWQEALQQHWPADAADGAAPLNVAFFAELLYRPISDALYASQKATEDTTA